MASDEQRQRIITWDDFGPWVKRLRLRRGLSQARLGKKLGCDRITVWRIEHGKHPSKLVLRSIKRLEELTEDEACWLAAFVELRAATWQ